MSTTTAGTSGAVYGANAPAASVAAVLSSKRGSSAESPVQSHVRTSSGHLPDGAHCPDNSALPYTTPGLSYAAPIAELLLREAPNLTFPIIPHNDRKCHIENESSPRSTSRNADDDKRHHGRAHGILRHQGEHHVVPVVKDAVGTGVRRS